MKSNPSDNTVTRRGTLSEILFVLGEAVGVPAAATIRDRLEAQANIWETHKHPPQARLSYLVSNRNLETIEPAWGESPDELYFIGAVMLIPGVQLADYQFGFLYNRTQNSLQEVRLLS